MSQATDLRQTETARAAVSGLPPFSSTALATSVGAVTREVMQRGAVVITKHEEPVMVLMSIERYVELERAGGPDLDLLSERFDELYARMQAPEVADRTIAALNLQEARPLEPPTLEAASPPPRIMPARIVVLAGVNGAGKSSVAGAAIRAAGGEFFDPDAAARKLLAANPGLGAVDANARAWEVGRSRLERALAEGEFFAFETTLGGKTICELLLAGAARGAEIHLSFVGLAAPDLHIERVRRRVAAGGHDIPAEKIRQRFTTSRANLVRLLPHLAALYVYDNTAEADPAQGATPHPLLLLHMKRGRVAHRAPFPLIPTWAKPLLAAALDRE